MTKAIVYKQADLFSQSSKTQLSTQVSLILTSLALIKYGYGWPKKQPE